MVQIEFLTTDELDKLRQFMEVTNIEDDDTAHDLLSGNQWNVEQALETFLLMGSESSGPAVGYEGYQLDPVNHENLSAEVNINDEGAGNNEPHEYLDEDQDGSIAEELKSEPLIPVTEQSVPRALASFATNFEKRYCSDPNSNITMPLFFTDTLKKAIEDAFNQENGKPLVFFINNEYSKHTQLFIQNGLCNDYICDLLKNNFIVFPWDVTEVPNLNRLLQVLLESNLKVVHDHILHLIHAGRHNFPLMIIVSRRRNAFEIIGALNGSSDLNEMCNVFHEGFQQFKADHSAEVSEIKRRKRDREILDQQNSEYEQSLMADLRRKREKQQLEDKKLKMMNKMKQKEEEENERVRIAASKVPAEPEVPGTDTITIKFRLPESFQETRLFYKTDKIQSLIDFLESKRYFREKCSFLNSDVPKKEITETYDCEKSFEEVNWPSKETIFVNMN